MDLKTEFEKWNDFIYRTEGRFPRDYEISAWWMDKFSQKQKAIRERILAEKVKNDDIHQFGCYNTEGNIRMQDGWNLAIKRVSQLLEEEGEGK